MRNVPVEGFGLSTTYTNSNSLYRTCRHSPNALGFGKGNEIHQPALHEAYRSSIGECIFVNLKQYFIEVPDLKMNFLSAFIYCFTGFGWCKFVDYLNFLSCEDPCIDLPKFLTSLIWWEYGQVFKHGSGCHFNTVSRCY